MTTFSKSRIGCTLEKNAAASADRLAVLFEKALGYPLKATDGLRSLESQTKIFLERYAPQKSGNGPYGDVRYWKGVRYVRVRGASAAVPGTSNHGKGIAVDFASGINTQGKAHDWMMKNAGPYGWTWPSWARKKPHYEPWHWEYSSARDKHKGKGGIAVANLPVIKPGDKGINVGRMQGLLIANGFSVGSAGIDNSNGPSSQAGLRAFQTKYPETGTKGKPDGYCGTATWSKLLGV